jgi:PAS domain-containing protein
LAVYSTATLIEQRLLLEFTLEEKLLCDVLFERANRLPADAIFAVDLRGRMVRANGAAERLLAAPPGVGGPTLFDDLNPILRAVFEHSEGGSDGYEQCVNSSSNVAGFPKSRPDRCYRRSAARQPGTHAI